MKDSLKKHPFGLALALALIIIPIIMIIAFGLTRMGTQNLNHADAARHSKKALFAAEAGAMEAIRQLDTDRAWSSGWSEPQTLLNGPESHTVEVVNNFSGTSTAEASNGAVVPPGTAYILASGFSRGNDFTRRVGVLITGGPGDLTFRYGIFAHDSLNVGNGEIDSFDSEDFPYNQTPPDALEDAPVGTNSTIAPTSGGVQIGATGQVGEIDIGVSGNPAETISCHGGSGDHSSCPSHGQVSSLDEPYPLNLAVLDPPSGTSQGDQKYNKEGTLSPGHYDNVVLSGGANVTLSAGIYVVQSLDVGGSSQLVVDSGPIKIYVTGNPKQKVDLNLSGNSVSNTTGLASNLLFMVGPDVEEVVVNGGPDVECAIVAPLSEVTINGTAGGFTGAVIAREATLTGNVEFHYDRALANTGGTGPNPLSIVSWQRI